VNCLKYYLLGRLESGVVGYPFLNAPAPESLGLPPLIVLIFDIFIRKRQSLERTWLSSCKFHPTSLSPMRPRAISVPIMYRRIQ